MAQAKKPVSSRGKATPRKKPSTPAKAAAEKATPAVKPTVDAKTAAAARTDQTTTATASKIADAAAEPKPVAATKGDVAEKSAVSKASETVKADKPAEPAQAKVDEKPAVETEAAKEPEVSTLPKSTRSAPTSAVAPVAASSGGGFWPVVLGGVVAAVLGFAASEANFMGWRTQDDSLRTKVAAQQDDIDALQAASGPDLSGIEDTLSGLTDQLAALDARIAKAESRPATVVTTQSGEPVEDVRAALTEMQTALEMQREEIEDLLGNARSVEEATAEAARAAAGQRALVQVTAAISNGGGYADAIAQMGEAGITDIPAALTDPAADGVVSLITLQSRFPDAARAALADARATTSDSGNNGVSGFLRRQLGARSVTPREGNDADAILSRAEAAVRDGKVAEAIAEIDALPDGTKDALQDWLADARVRADAEAAVQDLSQRLTAN